MVENISSGKQPPGCVGAVGGLALDFVASPFRACAVVPYVARELWRGEKASLTQFRETLRGSVLPQVLHNAKIEANNILHTPKKKMMKQVHGARDVLETTEIVMREVSSVMKGSKR